jgi:hypothetical protein
MSLPPRSFMLACAARASTPGEHFLSHDHFFSSSCWSRCVARFQWKQMKLIGHRGVGAEKYAQATPTSTRRTHIQENTVLSFVTASKSGADFIEFDVQVAEMTIPYIFAAYPYRFACRSRATAILSSITTSLLTWVACASLLSASRCRNFS